MSIRITTHSFVAAALLGPVLPLTILHAQTRADTTRLEQIVVTADRVERSLRLTPSTVTVLDGAALRESGVTLVLDALRAVPGIAVVQSGAPGSQAALFSRGGESDYTRVLIDGVPQNDPGGSVDLSTLTTDNVDRIEIVRGPGSVLYGSDAVTAVVQVFTRQALARDAQLHVTAGSLGQRSASVESQWRRGVLGVTAGASAQHLNGSLPLNNEFDNSVGNLRATVAGIGSLSIRHGFSRYEYPTDGAGNVVDDNANQRERRTVIGAELTRTLAPEWKATLTTSVLEAHRRTSDASDGIADSVGFFAYDAAGVVRRKTADARVQYETGSLGSMALGVEGTWEQQRLRDSSNYSVASSRFNAKRRNSAIYLQNTGATGRVSWSLGGRFDNNSEFGAFRTVRAGLAAQVGTHLRLRASGGSSFKAPTFFESNATAFSNGNSDLVPERGRSIELGADFENARVSGSLVWFGQRFKNLIQYAYADPPAPDFFNVAAARASGLEGEADLHIARGVRVRGGLTLLRTRVDDAGLQGEQGTAFVTGSRLLRRPATTLSLGVTGPTRAGVLSVTAIRIGERDDLDFSGFPAVRQTLAAYNRVDLSAQSLTVRTFGANAAFTLRVQNAFGSRYEEIANFAAPGRQFVLGIRLSSVPSTQSPVR